MSKSLTINAPQIVQTRNTLNAVPSGSTAEPDYSVKFVPQDLTEAQQAQARQNIGAISESEIPASAQADWNETDTESPAYIQNKPTIPAAQVQSDWNQFDTTAPDYIKNKPTIPPDTLAREYDPRNSIIYLSGNSTYTYRGNGTFEGAYTSSGWTSKNSSNEVNLTAGKNLLVSSTGGSENQWGELSNKNLDVTIIKSHGSSSCLSGTYTGKITLLVGLNELKSTYSHFGAPSIDVSDYSKLTTVWCSNTLFGQLYDGGRGMRGNYIYVDKPFTTEGSGRSIPNTTNLIAVYVPKNRKQEYITAITRIYSETADLTPITNKIVEYDFLNWIDDHTPQIVTLG